jgi:hypothetical protein
MDIIGRLQVSGRESRQDFRSFKNFGSLAFPACARFWKALNHPIQPRLDDGAFGIPQGMDTGEVPAGG